MKRTLALGLIVAGLVTLPVAARASNVTPRSVFVPDTVFARQWHPQAQRSRVVAPAVGFGAPAMVRDAPGPVQQPVWVDPGWAWDGWQWVWIPGHWAW